MLQRVTVQIDEAVAIQCPKVGFKQVMAHKMCSDCAYFDGVALMRAESSLPWYLRYAIRCAHPIERRTQPTVFREVL
jgi:hypothetical protein